MVPRLTGTPGLPHADRAVQLSAETERQRDSLHL